MLAEVVTVTDQVFSASDTGEMGVALMSVRAPGIQVSRKSSERYSRATS
jgi:hypothetical protein